MKKIRVLITGASGMAGRSVLNECLDHPSVEKVLCLNRSSLNIRHSKYNEIILQDFFDLRSSAREMENYDACFWCLGVSSSYVSDEEYYKITYELTVKLAEFLSELNPGILFCYVSGLGTKEKENSRMYWANIKGKTENKLLAMQGIHPYMIRLGVLYPGKGIRSKTKSFDRMYRIMRPLLFLLKLIMPKQIISSEVFGKALIMLALKTSSKKRITNKDMYRLAQKKLRENVQ